MRDNKKKMDMMINEKRQKGYENLLEKQGRRKEILYTKDMERVSLGLRISSED
jgi:hypothetical protein